MSPKFCHLVRTKGLSVIGLFLFAGNAEILEEINGTIDFSYVRILKMMYAEDDVVRLLAGSALAAFAYNNINQQKEIAEQGGVRFNCFVPFLQSSDEFYRCNAAFQVILVEFYLLVFHLPAKF